MYICMNGIIAKQSIGETGAPWDFGHIETGLFDRNYIAICSPAGQWYQN